MAQQFVYPKWIEEAWCNNMFKRNDETGGWMYKNPNKPNKNYKFEMNPEKDNNIQHGDIINFEGGYRNQGKWIWCEKSKMIKHLYTEIDDYGSVPPEFKVGKQFKPNHWVEVIDHNTIIWLEDDLYDKIKLAYDDKNNVVGEIEMFDKYYNIIISTDPKNTMEYVKNILEKKPCLHVDVYDLMLFC